MTRLWRTLAILLALYAGCLAWLALAWYGKDGHAPWHWFDDSAEWRLMDKAAHLTAAFWLARFTHLVVAPALPGRRGWAVATVAGWLWMLPIEIMDGWAATYGASPADLVANALGAGLLGVQGLAWGRIRIWPQFSYWPSPWAALRPNVLGSNPAEQLLKDYNAHTYWLGVPLSVLSGKLGAGWSRFILLNIGYEAEGMVYGHEDQNQAHGYQSRSSVVFSFSINWEALIDSPLAARHRGWVWLARALQPFKLPAPALQITSNGWRLVAIYR